MPRSRAYAILWHSDNSAGARRWQTFHLAVLGAGLLAVTLSSIDELPRMVENALTTIIVVAALIFLAEYALRIWVAPEAPHHAGLPDKTARLRWALSAGGLIGLLAVVPAFAITTGVIKADSTGAAVFCILWILKLGLHAPAMSTLGRVISNERATIASIAIVFIIVLVIAATATYLMEHQRQPKLFGDIPSALWWAIVTLSTTGYGDVVPQTVGGKLVGAVVMVSGFLVLALMTGVLATGFAEEERRREYLRVWDQVTKVPIFADLGPVTLSEIVSKLRVRHYPPRIVVVRRGESGDSMFFISEGEVEVRLPRDSLRLAQGAFFGEMALLDRLPRTATVATTEPTTLLVLYASDFYEIASHVPSLVTAVEKEAQRRHHENQAKDDRL
ncbi:MAG: cyclic nucleotide-gated ion channel [Alphaproteobacteria bacterium]|nr:cyclic nucleotide-gated ion channel [Alphaproteobacteria bacterium]